MTWSIIARDEQTGRHHPALLAQAAQQLRELGLDGFERPAASRRQNGLRQLDIASAHGAIAIAKAEWRLLEVGKHEPTAPVDRGAM